MPNSTFESLHLEILDKLVHQGVNGVSEKELLILVVYSQDRMLRLIGQPFWKTWTPKDWTSAGAVVLFLLSAINWQALSQVLNGVVQAAGR